MTGSFQTRSNLWDNEKNTFSPGDKIAVAAGNLSPVVYQLQDDGSTWEPASDRYLVWESEKTVFRAYYPAEVGGAFTTTFKQPTNYSSKSQLQNADYMTCKSEFAFDKNQPINLKLEHKMARLTIEIDLGELGYTNTVKSLIIHSNVSGYNEDGTVQKGDTQIYTYRNNGDDPYFKALLVPTYSDKNKTFMTITLDDMLSPGQLKTRTVKGIPELQAGYNYVLTVHIKQ